MKRLLPLAISAVALVLSSTPSAHDGNHGKRESVVTLLFAMPRRAAFYTVELLHQVERRWRPRRPSSPSSAP